MGSCGSSGGNMVVSPCVVVVVVVVWDMVFSLRENVRIVCVRFWSRVRRGGTFL